MKKLFFTLLITTLLTFSATRLWSQANTELSNLITPTKVNVNLQPTDDNGKDLGSALKSWKDIYIDGYLYMDGVPFVSNPEIANTFVGEGSGNLTTTGSYNSGFGHSTLTHITTGEDNSAFGWGALFYNTSGSYNSVFGSYALYDNTTGHDNAVVGYLALNNNTTGSWNVVMGSLGMYTNTTGNSNSAFGNGALFGNTTGSNNSATGNGALVNNSTGSNNSAFGWNALYNNIVGAKNVAVGAQAGIGNTTGNFNTFLGYDAGGSNATGSQNTYLGYSAEGSSNAFTNVVGIGYQITNSASNQVRIGNSSTTSIGGYTGWTNISDGRFKKNVKEAVAGLSFINKLRPVTYTLDLHAADAFVGKEFSQDDDSNASAAISEQAKNEKERIVYSGFIAQEVEIAARATGYEFSGVDAPKNDHDFYGLRYAEFVVPLVKAVQELSLQNDQLSATNESLQAIVTGLSTKLHEQQDKMDQLEIRSSKLEDQLVELFSFNAVLNDGAAKISVTDENILPLLGQNIPNPFDNSTVIPFRIPKGCTAASIVISAPATGRIITAIPVSCNETHAMIEAGSLPSGIYTYVLYVDRKIIDTKQMELLK